MSTFIAEPGTRLGGRYRLEDRVATAAGWAAWKAIDEILARAVTVLTFSSGFPRIREVITAARAVSRLSDARLAQVFDVEDDWDNAYIVLEWAVGDSLNDLIASGSLDPGRAAQIVAEAADALSSAHAAGLAHLCLTTDSLRWSASGGIKLLGLGIDAALSGTTAADPALADTRGLGKLLYAGLTGSWPGPDSQTLPPAPVADGLPRSPRQVRAGVPAALDDITCRALQLRSHGPDQGFTSPGQLGSALSAAAPPAPPPPPSPRQRATASRDSRPDPRGERGTRGLRGSRGSRGLRAERWPAGGSRTDGYNGYDAYSGHESYGADRDGEYGGYPAGGAGESAFGYGEPGSGEPGYGRGTGPGAGRGGTRLRLAGIAVLVLVVLAGVVAASLQLGRHHGAGHVTPPTHSTRPATRPGAAVLTPISAHGLNETSVDAGLAIDSSPATAWQTQWYRNNPVFGGLKLGSGLVLDMGRPVQLRSVTITLGSIPGASVQVKLGDDPKRSSQSATQTAAQAMPTLAQAANVAGTRTFTITSQARGRYLVIWFTRLPPEARASNKYQADIYNVVVRGSG